MLGVEMSTSWPLLVLLSSRSGIVFRWYSPHDICCLHYVIGLHTVEISTIHIVVDDIIHYSVSMLVKP